MAVSPPSEVLAQLEPGEEVRAWAPATAFGADRTGEAGRPRLAAGFGWRPSELLAGTGGVRPDADYFDHLLGGAHAEGPAGSAAHVFAQALGGDGQANILVTDRRLAVVLEHVHLRGPTTFSAPFVCPLGFVADVRLVPRPGQRGRVAIGFRDGSVVRPMLGMLLTGGARSVVAALGGEGAR